MSPDLDELESNAKAALEEAKQLKKAGSHFEAGHAFERAAMLRGQLRMSGRGKWSNVAKMHERAARVYAKATSVSGNTSKISPADTKQLVGSSYAGAAWAHRMGGDYKKAALLGVRAAEAYFEEARVPIDYLEHKRRTGDKRDYKTKGGTTPDKKHVTLAEQAQDRLMAARADCQRAGINWPPSRLSPKLTELDKFTFGVENKGRGGSSKRRKKRK